MFGYDAAVLVEHPAIRAGIVRATGLANGPSPPALLAEYRAQQQAVRQRLAGAAVADLPSIAAWRWCWRQSAQSATGETTVDALVVVEGQHEEAASDVASAVVDLVSLLAAYQPGCRTTSYLLSPTNPRAVDP